MISFQEIQERPIIIFIRQLIREIFSVSLVAYLIFSLIENFIMGFISNFLDLNFLLAVVIGSGVITICFQPKEEDSFKAKRINLGHIIFIILLALSFSLIIWFKIREIGWLSSLISLLSGILIILISLLMLKEESE